VVINVVTVPRPGGLWSVQPVLSNDVIVGTERLTDIERRYSGGGTVVGIGGDYFSKDGQPIGMLMRNGAVEHQPVRERSSLGIDNTGALHVDRVQLIATWQGTGQRRAVTEVNSPPESNGVALFTPAWGSVTPDVSGSFVAVVLE